MVRVAAILLLLAASSYGNVYFVTNDILSLNPNANTTTVQKGSQIRVTSVTRSGGAAYDLSGYTVRHIISDPVDNYVMLTGVVSVIDATNGEYRSISTIGAGSLFEVGKQYRGVSGAYTGNTLIATLYDSYIRIAEAYCSTCGVSGGGGGGSTSVTVTNLIVSTNIISVTVTNTGGGGGGSGTLSGFNSATTGGVFLVVSNGWDASITNEGNVFTIYTGLPKGATGVNQVATWNGTNWIATALGAPTPTPTVGTNVQKFSTVWGVTNTFVAPSTQIMFTAWGAGGGGFASGAGHARALWVGSAGTIFDIVIGTAGGGNAATNNGPFSGSGINASGVTNQYNGGGATYIAISGTTNIILIAGGSGGGGSSTAYGGPGGGFWVGVGDGISSSTQVLAGVGASASNEYGLAAIGGSNAVASLTNQMHVGAYLYGGHASTNGCTAGVTPIMGGGGGGWYGGGGATRTNATVGSTAGQVGGGGGLGFANTNYVIFAQVMSGQKTSGGAPPAQDHPTYTSGRGVGGANSAGQNGCAGAMW